jgi:hypothetical protein
MNVSIEALQGILENQMTRRALPFIIVLITVPSLTGFAQGESFNRYKGDAASHSTHTQLRVILSLIEMGQEEGLSDRQSSGSILLVYPDLDPVVVMMIIDIAKTGTRGNVSLNASILARELMLRGVSLSSLRFSAVHDWPRIILGFIGDFTGIKLTGTAAS